jgi:hypothetical protein
MTFKHLIKKPSAFIPLVMSCAALLALLAVAATVGVTYHEDEGAPARIFQLLMVLQVPIIAFFALKWVPRSPRPALVVLLLQGVAALLPIAVVMWLESTVAV